MQLFSWWDDSKPSASGNYRDLPLAVERLRPPVPLTPAQERAKLRRITQVIYSLLLQVR